MSEWADMSFDMRDACGSHWDAGVASWHVMRGWGRVGGQWCSRAVSTPLGMLYGIRQPPVLTEDIPGVLGTDVASKDVASMVLAGT